MNTKAFAICLSTGICFLIGFILMNFFEEEVGTLGFYLLPFCCGFIGPYFYGRYHKITLSSSFSMGVLSLILLILILTIIYLPVIGVFIVTSPILVAFTFLGSYFAVFVYNDSKNMSHES